MKQWLRRWKTAAAVAEPEPQWTPQDYLDHAKAARMAADQDLAAAIFELNQFDRQHPTTVNLDGRILRQFFPEQRKPYAARQSQAHARLMVAIAHEDVMIQRYAPSKEVRFIGGVRVA